MSPSEVSVIVFLELAVIVAAARLFGWLGRRFLGQPQVVGEIVAGVTLGPSVFGIIAPQLQAALFPVEARDVLYVAAQLGVGLYMFLVGLSFDRSHFRKNVTSAGAVSLSGIIVPFVLAILVTPWLMGKGLFAAGLSAVQATMLFGACIAITAFPVLARILQERGLAKTELGSLALSAGAIDDACAWAVLAVVLATFGDGSFVAMKAIGGAIIFAMVVLGAGPRLLAPLGAMVERAGVLRHQHLAIALVLFLLAAFAMDWAGMHAVFGGFLLGVAIPRGKLSHELREKLEPLVTVLLVPIFFTYSGLNTHFNLVADPGLLGVAAVVLAIAIFAKFGACWAAARLTGQSTATAMGVGALMNTRGMMELIIINIALERGLIGVELFTVLVLMTIVTTLMASPLFELVYGRNARVRGELGAIDDTPDDAAANEAVARP
jgi:Kef-type K+ transport system membrane component KefB